MLQGAGLGFYIETYCCPCKVRCKIRQPGGLEVEDLQNPDEEEDEDDGMPGVTRATQVRARRRNTIPQSSPTQHLGKMPLLT